MNPLDSIGAIEEKFALTEMSDSSARESIERLLEAETQKLLSYFIRRVENRDDAADLVSEVFLVIWRRAQDIPPALDAQRMWMFGIARRVLSGHRRSGVRRAALAAELRQQISLHRTAHSDPARELVEDALLALGDIDREIVTLRHWEGFNLVEIAGILQRKESSVRSRYMRARAKLRVHIVELSNASQPDELPDPTAQAR